MKAFLEKRRLKIAINQKGDGVLHISGTDFSINPIDIPHIAEGIARALNDDDEYSFIRKCGRFMKIYPGENYIHFTNGENDEYVSLKDAKTIYDFCIGYIRSLPTTILAELKFIEWRYVKLVI